MGTFTKLSSLLLVLLFISCSSTQELATNTDTATEPEVVETESPDEAAPLSPAEDWYREAPTGSPYYGTGVKEAYAELLADKTPTENVVVAIIDSGTDMAHEDLFGNIWVNEDEIAGNGVDDDQNGYVDDIYGWNFIGGADSTHVDNDTYEVTRIYTRLHAQFENADPSTFTDGQQEEYEYYLSIKSDYEAEVAEIQQSLTQMISIDQMVIGAKQFLEVSTIDSLDMEDLEIKDTDSPNVQQAKQLVTILKTNNITEKDITDAVEQYQSLAEYGLNTEFDPRGIVGDDYEDLSNRYYGNNDVTGVHNSHGTHVAGIVGAVRNNNIGIDGIANVKLMIIRTVPNGDERDKDVANAIRYAAENGADVINMSFGKGYSPQKEYVDASIRYADSVGVLMVHASGNDAENIDSTASFPTKYYKNGGETVNFITVGASSWMPSPDLTASFSNYGQVNTDIFAPGMAIYSTYPGNNYQNNQGTSMASPVVAGVAALVMLYYPELTATQVKDILLETATKPKDGMVYRPGTESVVPFSTLSVSGGIVNAYEALKKAEEITSNN